MSAPRLKIKHEVRSDEEGYVLIYERASDKPLAETMVLAESEFGQLLESQRACLGKWNRFVSVLVVDQVWSRGRKTLARFDGWARVTEGAER